MPLQTEGSWTLEKGSPFCQSELGKPILNNEESTIDCVIMDFVTQESCFKHERDND